MSICSLLSSSKRNLFGILLKKAIKSYKFKRIVYFYFDIYDINGKLIEKVIREYQNIGNQEIDWECQDIHSGVYFYSIMIDGKNFSGY